MVMSEEWMASSSVDEQTFDEQQWAIDQILMSRLTKDDEQRLADFDDLAAGIDEQRKLRSVLQQDWWECWADDQQYGPAELMCVEQGW